MKNYTIIPNEILGPSQISIPARYLLCVMLRHSGKGESCYPSQKTLSDELGYSVRYIRELVLELEKNGLIVKKRHGFNRPNTYTVSKSFILEGNQGSYHLGSLFPLNRGNMVPSNNTYRKSKVNNRGLEILRKKMEDLYGKTKM